MRLAQAITASGKPKGDLAASTGVALSTVSRWLGGTIPKAETLDEIARFLGVDAKWLLTGHEDPPPPFDWRAEESTVREDETPYRFTPMASQCQGHEQPDSLRPVLERIAKALEELIEIEKSKRRQP